MKSRSCTEIEKYLPLYAGGDLNNHRAQQRVEAHLRRVLAMSRLRGSTADGAQRSQAFHRANIRRKFLRQHQKFSAA
ncbi:MAG: hypothetical protein WKF84_11455 [Pyrinomonadaceae bacterium]